MHKADNAHGLEMAARQKESLIMTFSEPKSVEVWLRYQICPSETWHVVFNFKAIIHSKIMLGHSKRSCNTTRTRV